MANDFQAGPDGKILFWDKSDPQNPCWRRKFPIDVREQIQRGLGTLQPPMVIIQDPANPGKTRELTEDQAIPYFKKGWTITEDVNSSVADNSSSDESTGDEVVDISSDSKPAVAEDLMAFDVPRLRDFAKSVGVPTTGNMKKTDLVRLLVERDFRIPSE